MSTTSQAPITPVAKKTRKPRESELGPVLSESSGRQKRTTKPVEFMGCVKTVPIVRKKKIAAEPSTAAEVSEETKETKETKV
jgi:hypothetical protein